MRYHDDEGMDPAAGGLPMQSQSAAAASPAPGVMRWISLGQHRHQFLALALLALYAALTREPGAPLHAPFVLLHFAAILLWQPFYRGSTRVGTRATIVAVIAGTLTALWMSWLLLAGWLLVLIGLVGGEHARRPHDQIAQWFVVGFLFVALLGRATPPLFEFETNHPALATLFAGSVLLPVAMLFLRSEGAAHSGPSFDYLRSLTLTLFALLLAAGSALWTYRSGMPYPRALIYVLLFVGVLILACEWMWRRKSGHTMFRVLLDRYLLNLGSPFEHFLLRLSGPEARGLSPDEYLTRAMEALHELEWVSGVEAGTPTGETRLIGERTDHATEASDANTPLWIYTDRAPGPALRMHIQLLARLVQQLYGSRRSEAELRQQEKARAVYDTGARLTHDIKNLLQSLQSLSAAVGASRTDEPQEALGLVQRQLPYINHRLQATVEKLRDPAEVGSGESVAATEWWQELQTRYGDGSVEFAGDCDSAGELPRELFDTVAENLLENARYKQSIDRRVRIQAELVADGARTQLRIRDTGNPVPDGVARQLFDGAVSSAQGLGIGLHQCARLAESLGYELRLERNEQGSVCFLLGGTL